MDSIDRVSVEEFGRHLKRNISRLQRQIRENSYMPQAVESVHSPKFNKANRKSSPSFLENPFAASNDLEYTKLYIQL